MSTGFAGRQLYLVEEMYSSKTVCLCPVRSVHFYTNVLEREQQTYFLKLMINRLKAEFQPSVVTYGR